MPGIRIAEYTAPLAFLEHECDAALLESPT
jgi:hypothetical protein